MILSSLCLYCGVQGRCMALKDVFLFAGGTNSYSLGPVKLKFSESVCLTPTLLITKKLTGLLYDFIDTINT